MTPRAELNEIPKPKAKTKIVYRKVGTRTSGKPVWRKEKVKVRTPEENPPPSLDELPPPGWKHDPEGKLVEDLPKREVHRGDPGNYNADKVIDLDEG